MKQWNFLQHLDLHYCIAKQQVIFTLQRYTLISILFLFLLSILNYDQHNDAKK